MNRMARPKLRNVWFLFTYTDFQINRKLLDFGVRTMVNQRRQISASAESNHSAIPNILKKTHHYCHQHYTTKSQSSKKCKIPASMSCWQAFEHGSVEKLICSHTARIPTIQTPDDVLVEVHASSVNPIDVAMLGGYGQSTLTLFRTLQKGPGQTVDYPIIYGRDFSGTVVATGQRVQQYEPGDQVWGVVHPFNVIGTHAQFTVTQQNFIARKPECFSHIEAASLPYVAMSAWTAINTIGKLTPSRTEGKRVLILGGTGGVGAFAIQLLKAWGADVTCTCSVSGMTIAMDLGADCVIDYTQSKEALDSLHRFDFILDCSGERTPTKIASLLKQSSDSKYVTLTTPLLKNNDEYGLFLGILKTTSSFISNYFKVTPEHNRQHWALFQPNRKALEIACNLAEKNLLKPIIDKTYEFNDTPKAYKHLTEKGRHGKTVIDMIQ